MAGAGAAMMVTHSQKHVTDPHALVENPQGTTKCTVLSIPVVGSGNTTSKDTYCSYTALTERSPAFRAGAVMIPLGGLLSLMGLARH